MSRMLLSFSLFFCIVGLAVGVIDDRLSVVKSRLRVRSHALRRGERIPADVPPGFVHEDESVGPIDVESYELVPEDPSDYPEEPAGPDHTDTSETQQTTEPSTITPDVGF